MLELAHPNRGYALRMFLRYFPCVSTIDHRFFVMIQNLIVQPTRSKLLRSEERESLEVIPVHWRVFLLQVLDVEDVIVPIIFHYLRQDDCIEID